MRTILCLIIGAIVVVGVPRAEEPESAREEARPPTRAEVAQFAESLIRSDQRHAVSTKRFVVVSDSYEKAAAAVFARNFETVFTLLDSILPFDDGALPLSDDDKVLAYVFWKEAEYQKFAGFLGREAHTTSGVYIHGFNMLAFHLETIAPSETRGILVHECTHAYLAQRAKQTSFVIPLWFHEGLATYVGLSDVKDGEIHLGSYSASARADTRMTWTYFRSSARQLLEQARRATQRKRDPLTFETLFGAGKEAFENEKTAGESYGTSWLVVYYLRHGQPTWAKEAFPTFVHTMFDGRPSREALEAAYGVPVTQLEQDFRAFLHGFKLHS